VHAARGIGTGDVAIIGAGTLGLLTLAALRRSDPIPGAGSVVVTAKHPEQRRIAGELGADRVVEPDELERAVRAVTGSFVNEGQLTGGVAHVVDCVGSEDSLAQALRVVAPGGTVHVVGMPARVTLDLTSLWHREVALRGCYAYTDDDIDDACTLVAAADLGRLVSATYPLSRYREAIEHAANAGARGSVKIAFDLRRGR
jgi:threonine dehydrogenase-like Zn-dependent dehydrogenase